MSLHFTLRVNRSLIGTMEIRRITNTYQATLGPDDVSDYLVTVRGIEVGTVQHRYGDGPWRLVALGAELTAASPLAAGAG